jgi:hypothetical protein
MTTFMMSKLMNPLYKGENAVLEYYHPYEGKVGENKI